MSAPLEGRVALVTGGASGIGRATARALASAGARVLVVDVDEPGGTAVAEELGGRFFAADVSALEQNEAMVAEAVRWGGGLDLAHLNAGVASGCGVGEDFDLASYRRAMGVNLDGVVFGTHACLPALRARGGGAIVATASLGGLTPMPYEPIYAANKHAVVGLARSLGPALAPEGIRFNAVCPSFADSALLDATAQSALRQAGFEILSAEEVAEAVLGLLLGEQAGECVVVQPRREPLPYRFRGVPGPGPHAESAGA
jgi:NAD(P)-dependent dehydrogenase (short-subunit alcohol dehydrogenase family)